MPIIIKYIMKSMSEKKLRTFLILLAVMLSGALCLTSLAITDSLLAIYVEQMKTSTGTAEVCIRPGENSPSQVISLTPGKALEQQVEYMIPVLSSSGTYDSGKKVVDEVSIMGVALEDYLQMNKLQLISKRSNTDFTNNQIIISDQTAKKYQLEIGDALEIRINNIKRKLMIYGITSKVGIFSSEGNRSQILMPYTTLSKYLGTHQKPSSIYIKGKEGVEVSQLLKDFKAAYPKYEVAEPIPIEDIRTMLGMFSTLFMMMTLIVTVMSVFIVYTSFKVIMLEKMPIIGTFRSVGASQKMMKRVLILESSFYGVLGGIASWGLGIIILKVLLSVVAASEGIGGKIDLVITPGYLLGSFLLCIIICLASSILPILKVAKVPVKEIVLGGSNHSVKRKRSKEIRSIILVVFSIVAIKILPESYRITAASICVFLALIGIIGVLPTIIKLSSSLTEKLFATLFGNVGVLAVKNIKGNKSILNSMSLITLGVGILLMVNNIGENLAVEVVNAYEKNFAYDVQLSLDDMDTNTVRSLLYEEGVTDAYGCYVSGYYYGRNIELVDYNNVKLASIEGVSGKVHADYLTYGYENEEEKDRILEQLGEGRNIAFSNVLKKRYSLVEGQKIQLKMPEGLRTYEIIGFYDTLMNNGDLVQIGEAYFKQDIGVHNYTTIYLKTSKEPTEVLEALKIKYKDRHLSGATMRQQLQNNKEGNAQVMSILSGFSVLAAIIGVIGIINNLFISFIERKRSIAVLRSVGMNKKQVIQMIFLEALYTGLLGAIAGIGAGWIIMNNMPYVIEGMQLPPIVYFVANGLWVYIGVATLVTIVASISPAFKTSKLNIIEAIKFE